MGDYFGHWVKIGETAPDKNKLPKIFNVNWFRKGPEGKFLWPGYGDNIRVLRWIFERLEGTASADETSIGYVPKKESIDINGLLGQEEKMDEVLKIDKAAWIEECSLIAEHQAKFGNRLPKEMSEQFQALKSRLV